MSLSSRHAPFILAFLAIATLSCLDAGIKSLAPRYGTFQLALARFLFGGIFAALVVAVVRPGLPSRSSLKANAVRSLLTVVTALAFYYALATLPLAETIALSFLSPLFTVLFGVVLLKEEATRAILIALAFGLIGMAVIVGPQLSLGHVGSGASWGIAAALLSALTYALGNVLMRSRAQKDPITLIVLFHSLFPAILLSPAAVFDGAMPGAADLSWMALVGFLGTTGHLLLVSAYARAPAAQIAPFDYTALVWAGLLGAMFFGETPGLATVAGSVLIVAGAAIASRPATRIVPDRPVVEEN